jgi:hypothetical protein
LGSWSTVYSLKVAILIWQKRSRTGGIFGGAGIYHEERDWIEVISLHVGISLPGLSDSIASSRSGDEPYTWNEKEERKSEGCDDRKFTR